MSLHGMPNLDRVTWRDGQILASRDVGDDARGCELLRDLHIRCLHKTWGVVEGLNVVRLGSALAVTAGYALDVEGRELLLPAGVLVRAPAGPAAPATMYLVISQPPDFERPPFDLAELCPCTKSPGSLEAGSVSWKSVKEVRFGYDVLLARVLVAGGNFSSAPDTSIQRRASTMAQPRIWSDTTGAGQTAWSQTASDPFLVLQTAVDTSDAGFVGTPAYFARAIGAPPATAGFIISTAAASFTFGLRWTVSSKLVAAEVSSTGFAIEWLALELFSPTPALKGNLNE